MTLRTVLLALVFSLASSAQTWPWEEATAWKQPAGETRISPKSTCASLRALTGYAFSIISASLIPASRPEFCRVLGLIQPEIKFEVALPVPPSAQERMLAANPCQRVVSIDTDHSPFLSTPGEFTDHILSCCS